MNILKEFIFNNTKFNVNIIWQNNKPLFQALHIGNIFELKNIRVVLRNFDEDEKTLIKSESNRGEQNTIFLTQIGVYRLIMRSNKPIARPFQKWVCRVIAEVEEKGRYELELQNKTLQQCLQDEIAKTEVITKQSKHEALIEAFKPNDILGEKNGKIIIKRNVIYFGYIKDCDGKMLIKIGRTNDIKQRAIDLQKLFGSFYFTYVFDCENNTKFETFLHTHHMIKKHTYKNLINSHSSNEVYLMNKDEYSSAVIIAKRNVSRMTNQPKIFNDYQEEERIIKDLVMKQNIEQMEMQVHFQNNQKNALEEFRKIQEENARMLQANAHQRQYTQARGDKIQRYSKDGKELLQTYVGKQDAMRDKKLDNPSLLGITRAITDKHEYKGFRWASLDRQKPDSTFQEIGETNYEIKSAKIGFVAMLHLDKSHIIQVFANQKEAAANRNFRGGAAITKAIKQGSQSGGHYFMMWHECSDDLKNKFFQNNGTLPNPYVKSASIEIEQIDPQTKNIIKTYSSMNHVISEMRIARSSLQRATNFYPNFVEKGFLWRIKNDPQ